MPRTDVVPAAFAASQDDGNAARHAWIHRLPELAEELFGRWALRPDGPTMTGESALVIPVRTADDSPAALKLQMPGPEATAAILGLQRWSGSGMVRIFDSDADDGAMLLERLDGGRSLRSVTDDDTAILVAAQILARLHSVPPPDGLGRVESVATEMVDFAATAVKHLPDRDDRNRILRWKHVVTELLREPGECLLHWDLHFGNVLAADREPWLGIDPEPLVGDPGFDLWPVLDSGWSEQSEFPNAAEVVRRRFHLLTDVLDLDRGRAAGWTFARLMQNTLWDIEDGRPAISPAAKLIDEVFTTI